MADKCSTCHEKIKSGMFGSNQLLSALEIDFINEYESDRRDEWCESCGKGRVQQHRAAYQNELFELGKRMAEAVEVIPLASIHSPQKWDYSVVSLVTAQSTTGTGVLSEFTSSFADFFGTQSGMYNRKLVDGENLCRSILRKKAFDLGANAIVAVDIDYAEVGGGKGMLMVCMSGTAIRVANTEVLGENYPAGLEALTKLRNRIAHLNRYQAVAS